MDEQKNKTKPKEKLKGIIRLKYKNLVMKLTQKQTITPRKQHSFYPRIINNTDIIFFRQRNRLIRKRT
jgi:hypothetical protein